MDPSRLANPIALAFSVPAHLMTCWRLMSRALQGQRRYLLCPTTMTVKTCLCSSGWNMSPFFSRFPLLNDGMENGEWGLILKYQFPGWSRITYRLSVSSVILLRFDLLQALTYHRPAVREILVLNFSLGYWVASPCLSKNCFTLMAWLFSYSLTFTVNGIIKHAF